jgi:hypothetical protein
MSVDAGSGARAELSADGVFSGGGIKRLAFAGALAAAFFASAPTGENSYGEVP